MSGCRRLLPSVTSRFDAMTRIRHILSRLCRNTRATVLVETAFALPVLISLAIGAIEAGTYLLLMLKVQHTAVAIADLTTRGGRLDEITLQDIFLAAPQTMTPFEMDDNATVIINAIGRTQQSEYRILWQRRGAGTLDRDSRFGSAGALVDRDTLPALRRGETVVVTEVYYAYEPVFMRFLPQQTIQRLAFFRPREGTLSSIDS